jgi:hypothetical protein
MDQMEEGPNMRSKFEPYHSFMLYSQLYILIVMAVVAVWLVWISFVGNEKGERRGDHFLPITVLSTEELIYLNETPKF